MKEEFLLKTLDLPNGVPRKDVFRRVLMALRPGAFQACFANWLNSLRVTATETTSVDQSILAVDSKTAQRSHDRKNGLGALHLVSVWASEFSLSLGQVARAEKCNEITAISELLRLVDQKGRSSPSTQWELKRRSQPRFTGGASKPATFGRSSALKNQPSLSGYYDSQFNKAL